MDQKPLRRHTNADIVSKTKLTFKEHQAQSGLCSLCIMDGLCEIGLKAKTGKTIIPQPFGTAQFAGEKKIPNIEDIQILPELYGKGVVFKNVNTKTKIGGFKVKAPLSISAMGSTKVAHLRGEALSVGAAKAGISIVIGENVLATYGEDGLKKRIQPFLDNYEKYGAILVQGNVEEIKHGIFEKAKEFGIMGIELKIGQGAKQGLGGEIKFSDPNEAEKYRKMGYLVIKNDDDTFERHASPGSLTDDDLRELLIKYSELDLPIWIKTGMGNGIIKLINSLQKIKNEQGVQIECITVDGFGGGTGMSPWLIMNETSIPSAALFSHLREKPNFDILVAGGYSSGVDVAKAIMLGANGVAMGRPFLIAANISNYPDMKDKEIPSYTGVVNFVEALKEELQMICATQRIDSVEKLMGKKENLYPLSEEAAKMFGLKVELR